MTVVGQTVRIHEDELAQRDCVGAAWDRLKGMEGIVRYESGTPPMSIYAVEFPFDFPGGHDCHGNTPRNRGHFFTYGTFDVNWTPKEETCPV